ncbi:hypothetical protein GcM1_214020 [Golovinomyces cichoracearum]|uniref:F-box domain-containing protein n=1 Tax=Golovinomyces cichoracearum TaxID=62708 RepID=A0A420IU38_9PEZI|nr:hypothetical protein GcM1_214020 [Golovinomyces cichoracearum]
MDNFKNPHPLAFERVMEGTPISAHDSPLFKIPVEILTSITSLLRSSIEDLKNFALVNAECRQLARSYQFCTIKFDGGRHSESLLRLLQREAVERGQNRGRTRALSLGACVRRVVTNNDGYWDEIMASRPLKPGRSLSDVLDDPFDHDEEKLSQWRPIIDYLTHKLNENYRPNVLFVVSSLVNLESFEMNHADWNQTLLNTLVSMPLKSLALSDVQMTDILPVIDDVVWPIQRLDIRLSWDFEFRTRTEKRLLNSSRSWETILRLCSKSLQVLKTSHSGIMSIEKIKEEAVSFVLQFPKLQHLHLLWESHFGLLALRSLILTSSNLTNLAINYGNPVTRRLLDREGRIQSLRAVILNHTYGGEIPNNSSFRFLKKNLQIEALGFYSAETHTLLERVLKLVRKYFQLKKMSLAWKGFEIPESSLEALSSLSTLESIHLSSGCQLGWRNDWPINHEALIAGLKKLKNLRRIAFTRDSYSYSRHDFMFEYNSYNQLRHDAWDLHERKMGETAYAYAKAFPNLELLHAGEMTIEIRRIRKDIMISPRDDEMFSWERSILNMMM